MKFFNFLSFVNMEGIDENLFKIGDVDGAERTVRWNVFGRIMLTVPSLNQSYRNQNVGLFEGLMLIDKVTSSQASEIRSVVCKALWGYQLVAMGWVEEFYLGSRLLKSHIGSQIQIIAL